MDFAQLFWRSAAISSGACLGIIWAVGCTLLFARALRYAGVLS